MMQVEKVEEVIIDAPRIQLVVASFPVKVSDGTVRTIRSFCVYDKLYNVPVDSSNDIHRMMVNRAVIEAMMNNPEYVEQDIERAVQDLHLSYAPANSESLASPAPILN